MEKIRVFFATSNRGKLRELIDIFGQIFGESSLRSFILEGRAPRDCEETGSTFLANSQIKADCLSRELSTEGAAEPKTWVIADDSGLCVDCLDGRPGIHSARYAGDHVAPEAHMKKLLQEIQASRAPRPWKAHYHCALVLNVMENNRVQKQFVGEGRCFGEIVPTAQGSSGFGYDPIFLFSDIGQRFSELPDREKNEKSHRMAAFVKLKKQMGDFLR